MLKGFDMKKEDFWIYCLGWLTLNTPVLVELLKALVPVLAMAIAGYALYLIASHKDKGGKK